MWYAPGMGKDPARLCLGTIYYQSVTTKSRMRKMHPWQELKTQTPQLQHHLWIVSLLMQSHLGWSHQMQQLTHPRVVWINLLYLYVAHEQLRTDSHGGTRILVCWQTIVLLASGMHWLVCVFLCMLYPVCMPFSGEVQCEHTLLIPPHVC